MATIQDYRDALDALIPYAESRAEDLSDLKADGNEDPEFPGADAAWEAVEAARALMADHAPDARVAAMRAALEAADAAMTALQEAIDAGDIREPYNDEGEAAMDGILAAQATVSAALATALADTPQTPGPRFAVILDGGLVQAVATTDPALVGVRFIVIDYDTDGAADDETVKIDQRDGCAASAFVRGDQIGFAAVPILSPDQYPATVAEEA